jgi:NADH dehydrogenase [ubiquinone] 1 alpha subcomplex assembly factor 6
VDLAGLEDYAEASSARLIYLALEVLGVRESTAHQAGFHIGIAYALTGRLRTMPYGARADRAVNPVEIAAAASRHLDLAHGLRRAVARAALPALLPAIIAGRYLRRLKRAHGDPFDKAASAPDPLQGWCLLAAALLHRF